MLTIDALIAFILALAAPLFLVYLPSMQAVFRPVRVKSRVLRRAVDRTVHRD